MEVSMALTSSELDLILTKARSFKGTPHNELDCSAFVHAVFNAAGLKFPYKSTSAFPELVGPNGYFELVPGNTPQPGDVILFPKQESIPGHLGIWDPSGCSALMPNREQERFDNQRRGLGSAVECERLGNDAPFLSSRYRNNRGPDYAQLKHFKGPYTVYRWTGKPVE